MSNRIIYLREENNKTVGCVAISTSEDTHYGKTINYQVSVHNPRDLFNKAMARQLAIGRLIDSPFKVYADYTNIHDVTYFVMKEIASNKNKLFPSRAIIAAKCWIKKSGRLTT